MLCEKIDPFFDGELPPTDANAFRAHLADCARCQRALHARMQIEALGLELAAGREQHAVHNDRGARVIPLRPRRYRAGMAAGALAVAIAASVLLWYRLAPDHGTPDSRVASAVPLPGLGPTRPIEGRLSYAGADQHRPYAVQRAAGPAAIEHIPLTALARLEERGDMHGVAAAQILMGSRAQAATYLDHARQAPGTAVAADSDRALLALLDGSPETALTILDPVLERAPGHPQALWNRALALRDLGLPLMAAQAFEAVAAANEPGWHEEARAQADRVRAPVDERRAAWDRMLAGGRALMHTGTGLSPADVAVQPGLVRHYFYEAARAAPSREQLETLRPLARALDEHYGGTVLGTYLDRVGRSDFARRAPLAHAYADMLDGERPAPAAARALVDRVRQTDPAALDLLLGAMRHTSARSKAVADDLLPELHRLAAQSGDPWFVLLAAEEEAQARILRDDYTGAEQVLVPVLPACEAARIDYRCIRLEYWLGAAYVGLHRVSAARRHLLSGWARARRTRDWMGELVLLQRLSEIAYRQDDSGTGSIAAARAYLGELALRDRTCGARFRQHEILAVMLVVQNRPDAARREMERAAALVADGTCAQLPFTIQTAFVQAHLLSTGGSDADVAALRARLTALRNEDQASPGQIAFADYVEGRLLMARDRHAAHALLRRAIERARQQPTDDVTARRAYSHAYVALILDAGAHGEHDRALALMAEELGVEAAARCAVGLAAEQEVLVVARGADGALAARRQPRGTDELDDAHDIARVITGDIGRALAGCDVVDVYARSPYYGRARLLPADVAWRFRTRRGTSAAARPAPRRVVVADVEPPAFLGLPLLDAHPPAPDAELLRGAAATPAGVLAAITQATEIEIHAHGIIDSDFADASFLALSPGADGTYALTVDDIRKQQLAGEPLVILGACHAAYTTRVFHGPSSLASAFIEAGARTVIASPAPIPDADAGALLAALRRRIAAGQPAAAALRDERLQSADPARRGWIDEVVVFE